MTAKVHVPRRGTSAYVVLLIAVWTAVMAARLYPQLETAVRIGDRVTTVDEYLVDRCGERVGPAAETCLTAVRHKAHIQLRREQAKSVLIVIAPAVLYLVYVAFAAAVASRRRPPRMERKAAP